MRSFGFALDPVMRVVTAGVGLMPIARLRHSESAESEAEGFPKQSCMGSRYERLTLGQGRRRELSSLLGYALRDFCGF